MVSRLFSEQGIDQWRGILSGIQEKKAVLDAKSGGKPEQVVSAQNKLNNAVEDAKNFELHRLYFAALSDCYENLVELIPELFRAGGAMVKNMQIFIIGQTIPSEWYDGDTYFKKSMVLLLRDLTHLLMIVVQERNQMFQFCIC